MGLPKASRFLECVALDLKFYRKHLLLHVIDHATRLSASAVITSKKPDIIISKIFQSWIGVYGLPEKFLSDNSGEFANDHFTNICVAMNINFKLRSTESLWSNSLVERHNLTLGDMLDRILEESTNNIDIAVEWAINAKNSQTNIHGFSLYQLVISQNPILPCAATSKAPALTHTPSSKILEENLRYLHKARQAFIEKENSERNKRALNYNIRTYSDTRLLTEDCFKRAHEKRWRGPGKVLGQDGQQVLIKYGANYVRVRSCRITLDRNPIATTKQRSKDNTETDNENESTSSKINQTDSNSD